MSTDGGNCRPPGGVGRAPRTRSRTLPAAASAALALAAGVLLAGCGGSSRAVSGGASTAAAAAGGAATLRGLLARVLPRARVITVIDLRAARSELRLPANAPLLLRPEGPASAADSRRRELTEFSSLALPLVDDRPLFAALDLGRISLAVQFGGVQHSGLLIGTSEPRRRIASALIRAGWHAVAHGYRLGAAGASRELEHSQLDLFAGGLVIAYKPADADRAAAQRRAPSSDARLIALLRSSRAPGRFAAIDNGCLSTELAEERLSPREGRITLVPRHAPSLGDVPLAAEGQLLRSLGLVPRAALRGGEVLIYLRYAVGAGAPAGTVVELARTTPVYLCD
jgi:hypothetical protein